MYRSQGACGGELEESVFNGRMPNRGECSTGEKIVNKKIAVSKLISTRKTRIDVYQYVAFACLNTQTLTSTERLLKRANECCHLA